MLSFPLWRYRHYKNKDYEVLGVARHSETREEVVVYRALYDSKEFWNEALWVRPVSMFTETVIVDGQEIPRFTYVGA